MSSDPDECPGCGSSLETRQQMAARSPADNVPTHLWACPHCDTLKCGMCDMGDDVECISCSEWE